jgi:hypothetical protein
MLRPQRFGQQFPSYCRQHEFRYVISFGSSKDFPRIPPLKQSLTAGEAQKEDEPLEFPRLGFEVIRPVFLLGARLARTMVGWRTLSEAMQA